MDANKRNFRTTSSGGGTGSTSLSVSSRSLPGLVVMITAFCIALTGVLLMAAFGVDSLYKGDAKQFVGPILFGLGIIGLIIGFCIASKMNKKTKTRKVKPNQAAQRRAEFSKNIFQQEDAHRYERKR